MTIICLEGASAVGKTTTAKELSKISNTYIVPEVNLLFERPKDETKTWYLERQLDRWQIARDKQSEYDIVILDGDLFQPLSYNWSFDFKIFNQSLDFIYEFYRKEISKGRIKFPDKYFYLYTSHHKLIYRKENDKTRKRGNFEKHLEIIEPHKRYYEALNQIKPQFVHLMEANKIEENIKVIMDNLPFSTQNHISENVLDHIVEWLKKNKP
ncbi:AAA family ATPase [Paucisalibacillus sp. EB02]|uniref:AAA family ATPase n=1 Tax=Paucisalibacillus sp. EB02 TaxID=1347087 RepID=UPI0004AD79A8|nr:AAA family ATPase [Paucisalibacillus sp. EB02]